MGVKAFLDRGCDIIVAVGGKSAMDAARCIKQLCTEKAGRKQRSQEQTDTLIPFVAVPAAWEIKSA